MLHIVDYHCMFKGGEWPPKVRGQGSDFSNYSSSHLEDLPGGMHVLPSLGKFGIFDSQSVLLRPGSDSSFEGLLF